METPSFDTSASSNDGASFADEPVVDIVTIGESMLLVAPHPGQLLALDADFSVSPAGAESNVAIGLAQLGHSVSWVSSVGADPIGQLVKQGIAAFGVDTSRVQIVAGQPTGVYFKSPGPDGTKVHYYRAGSAASTLSADDLPDLQPRLVHVSGITAALSASCKRMLRSVIVDRHFGAATVAFDVNYRPALWGTEQADHARAATELRELAAASDIVFVGRDEAEVLWGVGTADEIRALLPHVPHLVVKDGDVEAVEYQHDGVDRVPARVVEVVEPVGAGDAFAAGWESAFLRGQAAPARLALGHGRAAAVLVSVTDQAK